jgi:hypothetical protein
MAQGGFSDQLFSTPVGLTKFAALNATRQPPITCLTMGEERAA